MLNVFVPINSSFFKAMSGGRNKEYYIIRLTQQAKMAYPILHSKDRNSGGPISELEF